MTDEVGTKAEGAGGTVTEDKIKVKGSEFKTFRNIPELAKLPTQARLITVTRNKKNKDGVKEKVVCDEIIVYTISKGFNDWLSQVTPDEFKTFWKDETARKKIKERLRHPGGFHEWMMVCRANVFIGWGVGGNINIKGYKTLTVDVCFNFLKDYIIKDDKNNKYPHCSSKSKSNTGTTTAHVDILKIIEKSEKVGDYKKYREDLKSWASGDLECVAEHNMRTKLDGGVSKLPEQLKI